MQLDLFCNSRAGRMWHCPCFWKSLRTTDVYIKDGFFCLFFVLPEQNPFYIWIWDSFAPIWSSHWSCRVLVTVSIKDGGSYSDVTHWFLKPWRVFSFRMQVYFFNRKLCPCLILFVVLGTDCCILCVEKRAGCRLGLVDWPLMPQSIKPSARPGASHARLPPASSTCPIKIKHKNINYCY